MEKQKCIHGGAELPFENKKVIRFPKNKLKQIYYFKCPECKKENKRIYRPSPPKENKGILRMFL